MSAARLLPLVVLALGLPGFAGTAVGQMAAFVNGTVLDADGKPVDGARIVFRFEGGISREQETRTDRKGSYAQVGLTPGPYTVLAEKGGVGTKSATITLKIGERLTGNFQFTPEAPKGAPAVAKAFQDAVAASGAGRNEEAIAKFQG